MVEHKGSSEATHYLKEFAALAYRISNAIDLDKDDIFQKIEGFVQKVQVKDKSSLFKTFEYVKSISCTSEDKPKIDIDVFKSILLYLKFNIDSIDHNKYINRLIDLYNGNSEREQIEFAIEIKKIKKMNKEMNKKIEEEISEEMTKKVPNNHYYSASVALCYTFILQIFYNSVNNKISYMLETILHIFSHDKVINDIKQDIKKIDEKIDEKIDCMSKEIVGKIDGMNKEINEKIDGINDNIANMNKNIVNMIKNIDENIANMNKKIDENIANMNEKIDKKIDKEFAIKFANSILSPLN